MWRISTFFGLLLLPNWLQTVVILVWVGCMIGCALTEQFFYLAVMFVILVLYLYVRWQFRRGRTFLGRMYDATLDGATQAVRKTNDYIQSK